MMLIGERIKELRKNIAMTQTELGNAIGVKQSAIRKYEHNEIKNIPYDIILKMSKVFKVSPVYLVGWDKWAFDEQLEHEVEELENVLTIFKALGYSIREKIIQSDDFYWQDNYDNNGNIVGKNKIPINETVSYTLVKNTKEIQLSKQDLDKLLKLIGKNIELFIQLNETGEDKIIDILSDFVLIKKYLRNNKE